MSLTPAQLDGLRDIAGADNVATDADSLTEYGRDWTRFYEPAPSAIVFARSIEQLQAVVRFARDEGLPLVPSGGRTGLSGGAVARDGEVVISFARMNRILGFNATDRTVEVEAGVITATLQQFAEDNQLFYPVDFASSGSSHIGGNIATNAGGIKVLRYGLTRDWVAGLKVITGDGELLDLNHGLVKNATGYDLRQLFVGAEGTLGLIVQATMRLTTPPAGLGVMLLAVPDMRHTISILDRFRSAVPVTAFEFFSDLALDHVLARTGGSAPFADRTDYYVLIEYEDAGVEEAALAAFEAVVEAGEVTDGVLSQSEQQSRTLWSYREHISESITPHTPYKNDIAVRISDVPAFLGAVEDTVNARYPDFEIVWFGHIGDGNLHLNILKPESLTVDTFKRECESVSEEVMAIVADYHGSVAAEHGVGLLKRDQLHYSRSAGELALMRSLKASFDPGGIMNPGKVLA